MQIPVIIFECSEFFSVIMTSTPLICCIHGVPCKKGVREVRRPSARLGESPTQTPNNSLRLPPTLGPTNEYENLEPLDERSLIPVAHESNLTAPSHRPREFASLTSENGGTQLPKSSSKASCDGVYENITMGFYPIRTAIFDNSFVNVPSTCYYVDSGVKDVPTFTSLTALVCYYSTYVYMKINKDGTINVDSFGTSTGIENKEKQ
ncbi:hypothetical protein M3Y96_01153700 [Aphelenchoides besseyi]|nr:hypothetical protein M3Y96_01153700 [Aphelenchoides besseyi]